MGVKYLKEGALSVVFLGICAAWTEFFVPQGKLRSAAAFTIGILLTVSLLQWLGTAAAAVKLPEFSIGDAAAVSQSETIVRALTDAECTRVYAADGGLRGILVTGAEESPGKRLCIRTVLTRIYSVEDEQILFSGR